MSIAACLFYHHGSGPAPKREHTRRHMHDMKFIATMIVVSIALAIPGAIDHSGPPSYRVVLDPGHGGIASGDINVHGDRYDMLSGKYLVPFAEGAAHRRLWEHVLVYQIAVKTKNLLDHCSPSGDFGKFREILKKFTDEEPVRIIIEPHLSRGDSSDRKKIAERADPNAEFRLYDYPDGKGGVLPGRISRINALKPHLVVSLHMTRDYSAAYRGMNPVIVAPYPVLHKGLLHLQGKVNARGFFNSSGYTDWFQESGARSSFQWFVNDSSFYFTGFPLTRKGSMDYGKFRGYRYNMVRWAYGDDDGWDKTARAHPENSPYARTLQGFIPSGRFWERENSKQELYRRNGGEEGFGGDNNYATSELIRYILHSLNIRGEDHPHQRLTRPFISTWSVPLLVNAVAAFIELGSLANSRHRYILVQKQDEIAEGLAVGIYSLFSGMKLKKSRYAYLPKGKKIDLERYTLPDGRTYFDAVVK